MSGGNWFHAAGADTAKDRRPKFVDVETTIDEVTPRGRSQSASATDQRHRLTEVLVLQIQLRGQKTLLVTSVGSGAEPPADIKFDAY